MFEDVEVNSKRWFDLKDLKNEEWRHIKHYNEYLISNYGRIKHLTSYRLSGRYYINGKFHKLEILKVFQTGKDTWRKNGYATVRMYNNTTKKYKNIQIHRLVAETFIPNPENKPQVNHKYGNKMDNRITELEWATQSENMLHAYKNGLNKKNKREKNHLSRRILQYDLQGNFIKEWYCIESACDEVKGHHSNIIKNCKNQIKSAYGYKWKYKEEIENGMAV